MQATTSEVVEGGTSKEGGEVLAPPPISIAPEQWRVPPPFFHPEQLDLVFDLRSQMADQVYHCTLMHQRVDMLYEAFSNAPAGRRCPTCARPYALPTRNEPHNKDLDKATSTPMGNCMARNDFWFWLDVQILVRGPVSSNSLMFSLVTIYVFMLTAQTTGRHPSWFPPGRADGRSAYFGHGYPRLPIVLVSANLAEQLAAYGQMFLFAYDII
jgi:hypothetical protein